MTDIFEETPETLKKDYPLYPHLSEAGALEAERVIEHAKKRLKSVCEEILGEIYLDIPAHIQSDAWVNFRNDLMDGFRDYRNAKVQGSYDFKQIRQKIFADYRAEILADLNQDSLEEIERLKKEVAHVRELLSDRRY